MKQNLTLKCITIALALFSLLPFSEADKCHAQGSVKNAYIWSDYPDPDIIRVGDYYYLVTTTMHLFPGGPIMRSKDLVNWETVSYLTDALRTHHAMILMTELCMAADNGLPLFAITRERSGLSS